MNTTLDFEGFKKSLECEGRLEEEKGPRGSSFELDAVFKADVSVRA